MAAANVQVEARAVNALTYHGGRLDEAARRYPYAPGPWIDLSTGINPTAWDAPALAPVDLCPLPSLKGREALETAAAAAFGAPALPIAALPGSEIGLRLLATLSLPRPWRIVGPGYRTHRDALPGAHTISPDELEAAVDQGGTLLLANPNNPDGRVIAPTRLAHLAARLAARGGMLLVDEAFADATPGASLLPLLGPDDPVLVLRSFGKFYGLAGVRLGFATGSRALVANLAGLLGDWPVSSSAIAIGTAAYRDAPWAAAARRRLMEMAAARDAVLRAHGLAPRGDCPLFTLVEHFHAAALFERLAGAGILTRPFDYAPAWLRFGLPDGPAALARLDAALGRG